MVMRESGARYSFMTVRVHDERLVQEERRAGRAGMGTFMRKRWRSMSWDQGRR